MNITVNIVENDSEARSPTEENGGSSFLVVATMLAAIGLFVQRDRLRVVINLLYIKKCFSSLIRITLFSKFSNSLYGYKMS